MQAIEMIFSSSPTVSRGEQLERIFRFSDELLELRCLGDWNGDDYLDLAALVKHPTAPESPVDAYELYLLFGEENSE